MPYGEYSADFAQQQLIFASFDPKLAETLEVALEVARMEPDIVAAISADMDRHSLAEKASRTADAEWEHARSPMLAGFDETAFEVTIEKPSVLETGRPRMSPLAVYLFLVLKEEFGGLGGKAWRRISDSCTARGFIAPHVSQWPGERTVRDHVNGLSENTLRLIMKTELRLAKEDGLDQCETQIADSTAVASVSAWPTDSGVILKLLSSSWELGSRLFSDYGVKPWRRHWTVQRLKSLSKLNLAINTASGKGVKRRRKRLYRKLLRKADKVVEYLLKELAPAEERLEELVLPPSRKARLEVRLAHLTERLVNARATIAHCYIRRFEGTDAPELAHFQRVFSVSDPDAAFIVKGNRETVFGYRPQVSRSECGLITAVLVEAGNVPDSLMLEPLVSEHWRMVGANPRRVSADDGYASRKGVKAVCEKSGVSTVSISGSKGKKLTGNDLYYSDEYVELRRLRSRVEGTIFVLKYCHNFGLMRRGGIAAVRRELLDKVVVYNFARLALLRRRRGENRHSPPLARAG